MPKFDLEDTHDNAVYMSRRAGFYGLWSSVGEALVTRTVREASVHGNPNRQGGIAVHGPSSIRALCVRSHRSINR